jgi:hypothetical protein
MTALPAALLLCVPGAWPFPWPIDVELFVAGKDA